MRLRPCPLLTVWCVHCVCGTCRYETFLRRREERLSADDADLSRQTELLKREAAWDAKSPRARQAKSKSRSAAFEDLKDANAQRMNDRTMSAATAGSGVDLGAAAAAAANAQAQAGGQQRKRPGGGGTKGGSAERWLGDKVVSFDGARLSVATSASEDGEESVGTLNLLDGLSYSLSKGERVGVVGRNGAGKTSFLRVLVGETPLTNGVRSVGDTVCAQRLQPTTFRLRHCTLHSSATAHDGSNPLDEPHPSQRRGSNHLDYPLRSLLASAPALGREGNL